MLDINVYVQQDTLVVDVKCEILAHPIHVWMVDNVFQPILEDLVVNVHLDIVDHDVKIVCQRRYKDKIIIVFDFFFSESMR